MNRATPRMREIAKRLMVYEARENKPLKTTIPAAVLVADKLRSHLATLMGIGGFRALVSHALVLAGAEVSWLRTVRVTADGSLLGLDELHSQLDPDDFFDGGIALIAQLFGLLVAFVGESLALRLVREAWPKILPGDLDIAIGGKNEKEK